MRFQPYIGQKPRVAIADHLGHSLELLGSRKGAISARYRGLDSSVSDQILASLEGLRDHLQEAIPSVKKGTDFVNIVPQLKKWFDSYWCTSLLLYLSLKSRKKSVKLVLVNPLCFCYIIPLRITLVSELCSNHHLTPRKKKIYLCLSLFSGPSPSKAPLNSRKKQVCHCGSAVRLERRRKQTLYTQGCSRGAPTVRVDSPWKPKAEDISTRLGHLVWS